MPWTVKDVDDHKKGLSDKQKKQWCRIANAVLKKCTAKGGTEKECAVSAIRQANGVVGTTANAQKKGTYIVCKNKQESYEVKLTVHQEKPHLVIPVVMMVEGVHNGSQGPLLHTIGELGKFPASWNGIPVVIYHPEIDGEPVSANSPDIIDTRTVGRVYNTEVEDNKLKAEVWLDEDKLNTISADTLEMVNNSQSVEVSLGMFSENEESEGEWEGEKYIGIAKNHRPDHLAILPDQIGACSCADGCGLGANKNNKDMKIEEMVSKVLCAGYAVNQIGNNTDAGYREKMDAVYSALQALNTENKYHYLEEMYDTELIYGSSGKMYKQDYKYESGKIVLEGSPVEVHKKVEYITNSLVRTRFNNNSKEEDKMVKENPCPKCVEKINALLANKESGFTEDDKEWLNTLTEGQLDKVSPKIKEVEKIVEKTVEVNKLKPEDQAALEFGKRQLKERREKYIKGILDNTKDVWTNEKLITRDDDTLEGIYKSVVKESVDYSLNGGVAPVVQKSGSGGPLYPAGVVIDEK